MKEFRDSKGRQWLLELNVATLQRIKSLHGVDLLQLVDGGGIADRLETDPVLCGAILWIACRAQAAAAGIDEESFGEALAGDVMADALIALLAETISFFPRRKRAIYQRAIAQAERLMPQAIEVMAAEMESPENEARLLEAARQILRSHLVPSPGN